MTKKQRRREAGKPAPEARGGNLTAGERTVLKKLAQAEARKDKKKERKEVI